MLQQSGTNRLLVHKCCFEPLYAPDRCSHRQRYLDAEEYIISRGIKLTHPDYDWWAWKAARSLKYGHDRIVEISSVAYKIYGWDVMTSVLIHEYGHCDLFTEGIGEGSSREEDLEIEKTANQRGRDIMPPSLVPEHYAQHREFFLKSYLDNNWSEQKCLEEWSRTLVVGC
jgi:hypothetical protein